MRRESASDEECPCGANGYQQCNHDQHDGDEVGQRKLNQCPAARVRPCRACRDGMKRCRRECCGEDKQGDLALAQSREMRADAQAALRYGKAEVCADARRGRVQQHRDGRDGRLCLGHQHGLYHRNS